MITNETSNICDYIQPGKNGIIVKELSPANIADAIENAPREMQVDRGLFSYDKYNLELQKVLSEMKL